MKPDTCWVASELPIAAPGGALTIREVQLRFEDGYFLRFQVDADTWTRIDQDELFGLRRDRRGPTFMGGFGDGPVEIEAQLRPDLERVLHGEDILDRAAMLLATPNLHRVEAWQGRLAVQERVPGLKAGFQMQ